MRRTERGGSRGRGEKTRRGEQKEGELKRGGFLGKVTTFVCFSSLMCKHYTKMEGPFFCLAQMLKLVGNIFSNEGSFYNNLQVPRPIGPTGQNRDKILEHRSCEGPNLTIFRLGVTSFLLTSF